MNENQTPDTAEQAAQDDPEIVVEAAQRALDRLSAQRKFAMDEVGLNARWLTASLLAVNGAGLLTVASLAKDHSFDRVSALLFSLGAGFALLSGNFLQSVYNNADLPLDVAERFWLGAKRSGVIDSDARARANAEIAKMAKWHFLPPTAGWISGALWALGSAQLALGIL